MGLHRMYLDGPVPNAGGEVVVSGDEAQHALRVKRVEIGERVELLDGCGQVGVGELLGGARERRSGQWTVRIRVERVERVAPTSPRLEVWSAAPKGDRLDDMIDQLAQVGAACWGPLACERSVVDPREGKLQRLARRAREASKQCGRAWALEVGAERPLGDVLGERVVVAHAAGGVYTPSSHGVVRLLVGPEGGFSERELARAADAGATIVSFGPHAMRIETASVVASSVILDVHRR